LVKVDRAALAVVLVGDIGQVFEAEKLISVGKINLFEVIENAEIHILNRFQLEWFRFRVSFGFDGAFKWLENFFLNFFFAAAGLTWGFGGRLRGWWLIHDERGCAQQHDQILGGAAAKTVDRTKCPVAGLTIKDQTQEMMQADRDDKHIVIVTIVEVQGAGVAAYKIAHLDG